jgi:hypothetical protein
MDRTIIHRKIQKAQKLLSSNVNTRKRSKYVVFVLTELCMCTSTIHYDTWQYNHTGGGVGVGSFKVTTDYVLNVRGFFYL